MTFRFDFQDTADRAFAARKKPRSRPIPGRHRCARPQTIAILSWQPPAQPSRQVTCVYTDRIRTDRTFRLSLAARNERGASTVAVGSAAEDRRYQTVAGSLNEPAVEGAFAAASLFRFRWMKKAEYPWHIQWTLDLIERDSGACSGRLNGQASRLPHALGVSCGTTATRAKGHACNHRTPSRAGIRKRQALSPSLNNSRPLNRRRRRPRGLRCLPLLPGQNRCPACAARQWQRLARGRSGQDRGAAANIFTLSGDDLWLRAVQCMCRRLLSKRSGISKGP
jgi:hypothetical protein